MMNFALYVVTVNATSAQIDVIRTAIEARGLFIFNLSGVKQIGESTFECSGCFIKQGR